VSEEEVEERRGASRLMSGTGLPAPSSIAEPASSQRRSRNGCVLRFRTLLPYTVVTQSGDVCDNGRIEKRTSRGWLELIPSDPNCHQVTVGYVELGQDDGWF